MVTTTEATTGTDSRHIYWQLIAPGAVLLLLGLRLAGDDGPAPQASIIGMVAVGGVLLLVGLVRSFGMKPRR